MNGLRSAELTERVAAIAVIHGRGTATAEEVDDLVVCLGDEYKPVQRRAADALLALQQHGLAVVSRVQSVLTAASLRQRWGAAYALTRLGVADGSLVPVLLEVLGSDDGDRRWAAAQTLVGLCDEPTVMPGLFAALCATEPMARKMALYCLRDIGRAWEGSDADLLAALGDPDPAVRMAALSAMTVLAVDRIRLAEAGSALLADAQVGVSRAAAPTLGKLGVWSPVIGTALQAAAEGPDAPRARAAHAALQQLRRQGSDPPHDG